MLLKGYERFWRQGNSTFLVDNYFLFGYTYDQIKKVRNLY